MTTGALQSAPVSIPGTPAPDGFHGRCRHGRFQLQLRTAMPPAPISLTTRTERWPIAGTFTISRGAKTEAAVVVAELSDGHHRGRGECVPYARYGETVESVVAAIEAMRRADRRRASTASACNRRWPRARRATRSIARSGTSKPSVRAGRRMSLPASPSRMPLVTAYTISLATPDEMAAAAAKAADRALLKVKLGGPATWNASPPCGVPRRTPN